MNMNKEQLSVLKSVQRFINSVPNKKFEGTDSYTIASRLDKVVEQLEKEPKPVKGIITVLETLRRDAEMALSGKWDCTTQEGIETGFTAQITLIDNVLNELKNK